MQEACVRSQVRELRSHMPQLRPKQSQIKNKDQVTNLPATTVNFFWNYDCQIWLWYVNNFKCFCSPWSLWRLWWRILCLFQFLVTSVFLGLLQHHSNICLCLHVASPLSLCVFVCVWERDIYREWAWEFDYGFSMVLFVHANYPLPPSLLPQEDYEARGRR